MELREINHCYLINNSINVLFFLITINITITYLQLSLSRYIIVVGIIEDNNVADFGGPGIELILFFAFGYLLFLNEGYQVALLGIKNDKIHAYTSSPKVYKIFQLMFEDKDEMPRLFLGQSFQVVLSTFVISQLTTFNKWESDGTLLSSSSS